MADALQPTTGPWRWEFNRKHKSVSLQGGERPFDLTVMDFVRWGTFSAVPILRDPAIDGMNVMHRLCDRTDWITPFLGRSHHADWCADVIHPDMRLMAAAPMLRDALAELLQRAENFHAANVKFTDFAAARSAMDGAQIALAAALYGGKLRP